MFVSLYLAGVFSGVGLVLGCKKIGKLMKENKEMAAEVQELKNTVKELKDDILGKKD